MPSIVRGLAAVEVQSESYTGRTSRTIQSLVVWGERALALAVVVSVLVFAVGAGRDLVGANWGDPAVLAGSIGSALLVGIGLELARLLVTHELVAVLELMAFALARKILTPGLGATEMLVIVLAFIALVGTRRYLMPSVADAPPDNGGTSPGQTVS